MTTQHQKTWTPHQIQNVSTILSLDDHCFKLQYSVITWETLLNIQFQLGERKKPVLVEHHQFFAYCDCQRNGKLYMHFQWCSEGHGRGQGQDPRSRGLDPRGQDQGQNYWGQGQIWLNSIALYHTPLTWRLHQSQKVSDSCLLINDLNYIQTCQVSRISRETDAFSSNSRVSARMELISRIFEIFKREKNRVSGLNFQFLALQ